MPDIDPRIGDENEPDVSMDHINSGASSKEAEGIGDHGKKKKRFRLNLKITVPSCLQWVPKNTTWSQIKPVIRCSVVAWICLLFVIIPQTAKMLGQANFLILIAAFISPPYDPFLSVLERQIAQALIVTIGWAWTCLGIKLADLARSKTDLAPTPAAVYSGGFLEPGPTAIMMVFLFFGSAILLYVKARLGFGPYFFGILFCMIGLDISFNTAPLFPVPFYQIGQAIAIPIYVNAGLSIFFSAILFPSTISSMYINRCRAVLTPLVSVLSEHRKLLNTATGDPDFSSANVNALVSASENALGFLAAALHLLKKDIVWSRVSPAELAKLHVWVGRLVMRANGMSVYFSLIDPTRERFLITPAPSHPSTPIGTTPDSSRPPSPLTLNPQDEADGNDETNHDSHIKESKSSTKSQSISTTPTMSRRRHFRLPHSQIHAIHEQGAHELHHHRHHLSHGSLLHLALSHARQPAVGVFESRRYADIEAQRLCDSSADYAASFHALLGDSCSELMELCGEGLTEINTWLGSAFDERWFQFWRSKKETETVQANRLDGIEKMKRRLDDTLEKFRAETRHLVIGPYRSGFEPSHVDQHAGRNLPSHRHLFHCYMYQFHLMQFAVSLSEFLNEIIQLQKWSTKGRLWMPTMPLRKWFSRNGLAPTDEMDKDDDEDPDVIQGMDAEWVTDLGLVRRRDPDALPPRNWFEFVMNTFYKALAGLSRGNALYALKAGILTVLLTIPSILPSTALFANQNKFVWGIFMGQLTLVRFRGDTTFGLISRIFSTFFGCLAGTVLWYMSTGSGHGNPYGLAVVCGVFFPFLIFGRLYWPGSPMTNIIFFVTIVLVIGYSWLNTHPLTFTVFLHWGLDLAIRRFILVVAGVTAAFIFSFLPPSTTLRHYQRGSLATTSGEIGAIYCSIVSFANTRSHNDDERQEIIQSLIAIRSKLKRSLVLKANIVYEFSLRGRWPAQRYQTILEIQLQIAYLLSHLMAVVCRLEPAWSRAFLRRSRFLDADFQGAVLAVISMVSTALRTGNPLPQITPCPLLERFSTYNHGLNVVRHEADGEYGLPRTMTIDTLMNEQYMFFCVGVTTAYGIIHRLDRLMVATKELVGEQYHIHGIGAFQRGGHGGDDADRDDSRRSGDPRQMEDV